MMIDKRIQDGEARKGHIIILAPTTTLTLAWQKQIRMFTPHLTSKVLNGSYVERMTAFLSPAAQRGDILLINYEAFAMKTKIPGSDGTDKVVPLSKICGLNEWDIVVLDECHKIKNPEAKRTGQIISAFKDAKFKLIMSGTINANKLHDIHIPFIHLNKAEQFNSKHHYRNGNEMTLGDMHGEFKEAYFDGSGFRSYPKGGTVRELRDRLEEVSVRFEKSECLTLPDKMYMPEELIMSVRQQQLYNAIRDKIVADLADIHERGGRVTAVNVLAKLVKLAEAANGWIYDDNHNVVELPWNPKLDRLLEIVSDIDLETQKVVVWSRFTHDIHVIAAALREVYGDDAVVAVHGGGSCKDCGSDSALRTKHVRQFLDMEDGNKVKIAVLNQATGSHGIDLTSATYEIFYSNSFSKTDRLQAEDRCHRTGMRESLTIIDLICKGTVDEQIMSALMTHKAMTTALLSALGLDLEQLRLENAENLPDEEPVIKIQIQQQGEQECLLASCAMIAGRTIEEARRDASALGLMPWRGTQENMLKLLKSWNVRLTQVQEIQEEKRPGLAVVRWPAGGGHAIAFHKGQVFDPTYDKPKSVQEWYTILVERGGGYIIFGCVLSLPLRVFRSLDLEDKKR